MKKVLLITLLTVLLYESNQAANQFVVSGNKVVSVVFQKPSLQSQLTWLQWYTFLRIGAGPGGPAAAYAWLIIQTTPQYRIFTGIEQRDRLLAITGLTEDEMFSLMETEVYPESDPTIDYDFGG